MIIFTQQIKALINIRITSNLRKNQKAQKFLYRRISNG
jgi:hypothetical protein